MPHPHAGIMAGNGGLAQGRPGNTAGTGTGNGTGAGFPQGQLGTTAGTALGYGAKI